MTFSPTTEAITGSGDDESCHGDGGMSAVSFERTTSATIQYNEIPTFKPITSSPCEDVFFGEHTCEAKGFYPTN
jgi:hypothetical protein